MKIDLNSDLGEGFGAWDMGNDDAMLNVASSVNIACGFHAGDSDIMLKTAKLAKQRGVSIGALYLQMALHLDETSPFTLAALANVHETTKNYEAAIAAYDRIPEGSPWQQAVDIRKAQNLNLLDRVDEAKAILERMAAANPEDIRPLDALGNMMRIMF